MKEKIRNWMKDGRGYIYGAGLMFASLCVVAFGGAYLGANVANHQDKVTIVFEPEE